MNNYCLTTTWECNWDCPYCIVDTHSQKQITIEQIKQKLKLIKPKSTVSLSGGEPGMLKEDNLKFIIDELLKKECEITVNTNGLFFKKYHKFDKYIQSYLYHCTENIDNDIIIPEKIDLNKIDFMIVVTDNNMTNLKSFLEKYKDLNIKVFGADKCTVNGKEGEYLSKRNAFKIIKEYKHLFNPDSILYLLNRCSEVNEHKHDNDEYLQRV